MILCKMMMGIVFWTVTIREKCLGWKHFWEVQVKTTLECLTEIIKSNRLVRVKGSKRDLECGLNDRKPHFLNLGGTTGNYTFVP